MRLNASDNQFQRYYSLLLLILNCNLALLMMTLNSRIALLMLILSSIFTSVNVRFSPLCRATKCHITEESFTGLPS